MKRPRYGKKPMNGDTARLQKEREMKAFDKIFPGLFKRFLEDQRVAQITKIHNSIENYFTK